MSDEVVVELLKELVDRLQSLEKTVYNTDNVLMKSGFVKVQSPTPHMAASQDPDGLPDISKMDWKDINKLVQDIEGRA